jgi:hypothetical protein
LNQKQDFRPKQLDALADARLVTFDEVLLAHVSDTTMAEAANFRILMQLATRITAA